MESNETLRKKYSSKRNTKQDGSNKKGTYRLVKLAWENQKKVKRLTLASEN